MTFSIYLDGLSKSISKHSNSTMNQAVAGVYVGTNETETNAVRQTLADCKLIPEPCHFGFSGWHNFDIMVQRKSARGVMADFNPNSTAFLNYSLMSTICPNRHKYAQVMVKYVQMNFLKFSPNVKNVVAILPDEEVLLELKRPGSWLSTDDGYEHIQKLAAEGKICAITEDIRNHNVFAKIAQKLKDNSVAIDTLYVSNISRYMVSSEDKDAYQNTIRHLFTFETKLIHCGLDLRQTVLHGVVMVSQQLTRSMLYLEKESAKDQGPVVEDVTDSAEDKGNSELVESLNSLNV